MTPDLDLTQDRAHTQQLIESHFVRPIAESLYRFDRKDAEAQLSTLDAMSRDKYLADATLVAVMRDPDRMRPALYAGANELVPSGLGSLTRLQRLAVVTQFTQAFKVLRDSICGNRVDAAIKKLAEADRTAEVH